MSSRPAGLNTRLMASLFMRDTAPSKSLLPGQGGISHSPTTASFAAALGKAKAVQNCAGDIDTDLTDTSGTLKFKYVHRQLWNHISNKNHLLQENSWWASKN